MGQVIYNNANNQYVMWFEGGGGQACATCSTPGGRFVVDHVQATITNVYFGRERAIARFSAMWIITGRRILFVPTRMGVSTLMFVR